MRCVLCVFVCWLFTCSCHRICLRGEHIRETDRFASYLTAMNFEAYAHKDRSIASRKQQTKKVFAFNKSVFHSCYFPHL